MTKRRPKDLSASVKTQLLNYARQRGEEFNFVLIRYGIERLLYRLSRSEHADTFVLKGAILFHLYANAPHRPTRDVDLLGMGSSDVARMENVVRQIVELDVAADGLSFDGSTVHAERIKEDQQYEGVRVTLLAHLGKARIRLQIDIGFGDAIIPKPRKQAVPCILDFEAPRLAVYPWETVVAEKYQALVELGMTNSRMKDFFDLQYMAREIAFDGSALSRAIRATFGRRKTDLPDSAPVALTSTFVDDDVVRRRWTAFVRRSRLDERELAVVAKDVWTFLQPVTAALVAGVKFDRNWERGGPWQ
ncbi:MAG: nucleotidyl transferase AbiEii/AbiGii toxin family protein [Candidatus Nealsonbacteria bacterium]|nr:nucleotidyl transferase AbiEii/AbiGii toxin family protein [Candidatus Nealsonbacteria bacterium]